MKKYLIITFASFAIILIVFATGYTKINNIEYTSAIKVEKKTAVEMLNYSGIVEYSNSSSTHSNGTGMVQSVLVNDGDYVEKGAPVLVAYETDSEVSTTDIMSAITSNNYDKISSMFESEASVVIYEAKSSGIVSDLNLEESSVYQKNQALFKVSPENSFQLQINVTENDIQKIKVGQSVKIKCKAVSETLNGTVSSISNSAKQTSTTTGKETTVRVVIKIDDPCEEIKTGYTASCSITVKEKENVILIPYSSVSTDENGEDYVYIVSGSQAEKHYIICGYEYNNGVEIKNGLDVGDIIMSDISEIDNPENAVIDEVKVNEQ